MLSPSDRDFYHANVCHVCKIRNNLRICKNCKSISYCSREHQYVDWSSHKKLCKLICHTDKMYPIDKQNYLQDQAVYLNLLKTECQMVLKRDLYLFELELLNFRKFCTFCNTINCKLGCDKCYSAYYCSDEHKQSHAEQHKPFCAGLKMNLELLMYNFKNPTIHIKFTGTVIRDGLKKLPYNQMKLINILFEEKYVMLLKDHTLLGIFSIIDMFVPAFNIVFGLEKTKMIRNRIFPKNDLNVNIVGAGKVEQSWNWGFLVEFVFHWIKNLQSLTFSVIGSDLDIWELTLMKTHNFCEICKKKNINIRCFSLPKVYHEVALLTNPDIIIAYNCGIYAKPSWIESIPSLLENPGVPLVLTDYTLDDIKSDVETIIKYAKKDVKLLFSPEGNFFSCVTPERHYDVKNLPLHHKNGYIAILTS